MSFVDRILTIVVTATLTSAVWIVVGGSLIENASSASQRGATRPAEAAPSPKPLPTPSEEPVQLVLGSASAGGLDTRSAQAPSSDKTRQLLIPVQNIRPADLTDTYSDSLSGGSRLHEAIDIMAPAGTSVLSSAPGVVEKLYRSEAGGRTVYVRSPDGETIYYYAHLDAYAEGLKEGQRVRRGQRIGTVGTSGYATTETPHLHFAILQTTADAEWWEPAHAVNPYPLLTGR